MRGLTTGVIHGARSVELELDFVNSCLLVLHEGSEERVPLNGQSVNALTASIDKHLHKAGFDIAATPDQAGSGDEKHADYSPQQALLLHRAFTSVAGAMQKLRAGIREETSPIQVWPHHFDLSMLWLPGGKIDGEDPADEEASDKQMNFGFVCGDETIAEPYFYVTAYPLPDELPQTKLPPGTTWRSEGFDGAVTLYKDVAARDEPGPCLLDAWTTLLDAGRRLI